MDQQLGVPTAIQNFTQENSLLKNSLKWIYSHHHTLGFGKRDSKDHGETARYLF